MRFDEGIHELAMKFCGEAYTVHPQTWQRLLVGDKPEAEMKELLNTHLVFDSVQTIEELQNQIRPNLPCADEHFEKERVSGMPINPGETWRIWPWGHSADKFRSEG